MFREISLQMADGSEKVVPFRADAATSFRFRQVFHRDLLESVMSIVKTTAPEAVMQRMSQRTAEDDGQLDQETLMSMIMIAESGQLETASELAYIMNRAAERADMRTLSIDNYLNWLEEFDSMAFLANAGDIIDLYMSNRETTSTLKKSPGPPNGP